MSEARVYLAEGAPLRRQNSAVREEKDVDCMRITLKKYSGDLTMKIILEMNRVVEAVGY